jgi:glycosyltransferase involved in cell wall biosynthesis
MPPLRVLHVAPYYAEAWAYGGIPRVVSGLAAGLARRGHEVTVATTDACDRDSRLPRAAASGRHRSGFHPNGTGVDVRVFRNLSNRLAHDSQLFLPVGLRRFLATEAGRFVVAHRHAYRNLPVAFAAAACARAGVPFVLTPNGTVPRIEARRLAKAIWDFALGRAPLERAARLLAVTESERAQLVAGGGRADRVEVVPNPLDLGELEPPPARGAFRARLGLRDQRIVLYLGRLSPRKRLDLLAQAFATLGGEDLRLVIAGSEMGAGSFTRFAVRRAGVEARTLFPGLLEGRARFEALADADVVAYATEAEIFGLVPLEALLCGTPVVVADDSGCGELIGSTGGGEVVRAGDAGALAAGLRSILAEPEAWRARAREAAARVRARFGADVVAEELEAVYRRVIAER